MIPHRNLDAPSEKDKYISEENRRFLVNIINKELGPFFWSSVWRGSIEPAAVDYLAERMAEEKGILASESRHSVKSMAESIVKEAVDEADKSIETFNTQFPWDLCRKCLKDEKFSDRDLQGPRNKISQWLNTGIEDPFLKVEMPMVIMAAMDVIAAHERKEPPKKRKASQIWRNDFIDYLLIDFKMGSGKYRFTHYHAMQEIVPALVDRLVPMMNECGVCKTELI